MSEQPKRKFKGVWIARQLWEDTELSWLKKCLLAEIDSFCDEESACFASDEYLAKMFNVTPERMANILSELRQFGALIPAGRDDRNQRLLRINPAYVSTHGNREPAHGNRESKLTETVSSEAPPYKEITKGENKAVEARLVFEAWNTMAKANGLPTAKVLTGSREKHVRARLAEEFFTANWRAALLAIPKSNFLLGRAGGDRQWKADFDWFASPNAVPKIMEGKYDDNKPGQATPPSAPVNPDVLVIGRLTFTKDTPPRREQFRDDGQFESYTTAWRKKFGGVK